MKRRSDPIKAVFGCAVFMMMLGHVGTHGINNTTTDWALALVGAAIGLALIVDERA